MKVFPILFLIFAIICTVSSLKCYICDPETEDENCKSVTREDHLRKCDDSNETKYLEDQNNSGTPVYECYKILMEDNKVKRGCQQMLNASKKVNCEGLKAKSIDNCEICSVDGCNSSSVLSLSTLSLLLLTGIVIFVNK